jgi:hypothetical protein
VGNQRATVRGLRAKRRSPLMTRPAKQALENRVRDRELCCAGVANDPPRRRSVSTYRRPSKSTTSVRISKAAELRSRCACRQTPAIFETLGLPSHQTAFWLDMSLRKALPSSAPRCSLSLGSAPDFSCGQSQWPTSRLAKRRGSDKVQPNRDQEDRAKSQAHR